MHVLKCPVCIELLPVLLQHIASEDLSLALRVQCVWCLGTPSPLLCVGLPVLLVLAMRCSFRRSPAGQTAVLRMHVSSLSLLCVSLCFPLFSLLFLSLLLSLSLFVFMSLSLLSFCLFFLSFSQTHSLSARQSHWRLHYAPRSRTRKGCLTLSPERLVPLS